MDDETATTEIESEHRIFLVDDHPVFRQGVIGVIESEADMLVCGQAESVDEALEKIEEAKPDIVLVDISLKGVDGLDLVRSIKTQHEHIPTLVLSAHDEKGYAERATRAGSMGYVMKKENIEIVIQAIRKVLKGQLHLSQAIMPSLMAKLLSKNPEKGNTPFDILSDRELEVFNLLGQGLKTRAIAEKLNLSPKTIQVYREHIKKKMNLKDSVELHQTAFQWAQEQGVS